MSSSVITPDALMPEIVAQLGISAEWARGEIDPSKRGEWAEDLCVHYRAMAICVLAGEGDVDAFFQWLLHSPITRKFYLAEARAQGADGSRYFRTGFVDPVLDAVVARQWGLASEIGALTSVAWMEGVEYEDDFCYGEFVRRVVKQQDQGLDALLTRWRAVLQGGDDVRLDVAEALRAGQADAFEATLRRLLEAHESTARKMADLSMRSPLASELPFFPNRWVSIEGLALLAIAERQGMSLVEDFDACPRLVRAGRYAPFRSLGYPDRGLD